MAFVNKASLREEFDHLKNQFNELQSENKLSTEANILFRSMIILFEVMISIFLEKKTKKNSGNSSIPPSQTNKDETSVRTGDILYILYRRHGLHFFHAKWIRNWFHLTTLIVKIS